MSIRIGRSPLAGLLVVSLLLVLTSQARAERAGDVRDEAFRLFEAGNFPAALPQFNEFLTRRPRDLEARAKRGIVYLRLNQPGQAVEDLDAVIRVTPWSYSAHIDRGIARVMMGEYEDARHDFDRSLSLLALTFNRDSVAVANAHCGLGQVAHRMGQDQVALEQYNTAIQANPRDPSGYLGRGEALVGLKQLERALPDFEEAIRLNPNLSRGYTFRGDTLWQLGRHSGALADFDAAIQLDPNDEEARSRRGSLLAQMGENERALPDLDAVIRLDPKRPAAYKDRGGVLVRLGQYQRAIDDLNRAIQLDPGRATSYQNRGAAYSGLAQYEKAVEDLNQAIHLDPRNPGARTNLGLALFALGRYERALAELTEATRLAPDNSLVFLNRAGTYARLNMLERAVADYNEALRLDPNAVLAHVGLGEAQDGLGRRTEAIHQFDMALKLNPKNAKVYISRGNARRAAGDWAGALDDFSKAIEIDPNDAEAYVLRGWSRLCTNRDGADTDARAYLAMQKRPDKSTLYMSLLGAFGARRAGHETEARIFLAEALGGTRESTWPAPVLRYMYRTLPAQAMLEAANDDLQKTEAHVFLALDLLQAGKQAWAVEHLLWARDHGVARSSSGDLARVVLLALEAEKSDPLPRVSNDSRTEANRR